MINKWMTTALIAFLTLFSQISSAYSIDTHFYECYAMARWAGIGHEVALELATYNQWIDVQLSSSAMFPTWVLGGRIRRLYHFPTNKVEYKSGVETNHGQEIKVYGLATKNHPFASELLTEGLRSGNLLLAGGGLHVLMDSFAHSGNGYSVGHSLLGHWPDRPYTYIEKHNAMRETLFRAFVAVRKLLPAEALDPSLNTTGAGRNVDLDAKQLFETYKKNEVIKKIVESDPTRDPRYVLPTLQEIISSARRQGLVTDQFDLAWIQKTFPNILQSGLDARDISEEVFRYLVELPEAEKSKLVNLQKVYETILPELPVGKTFNGVTITRERFAQELGGDGKEIIVDELVRMTTWAIVPDEPFRDRNGAYQDDGFTPKAAFEHEGQYSREENIKISDWQNGLKTIFGTDKIVFAGSNWFTKVGALLAKSNSQDSLFDSFERIDKIQMRFGLRMSYYWYHLKYSIIDFCLHAVTSKLVDWKVMSKVIGKARTVADPANMLYQMEDIFDQLLEKSFYRPLLSDEKVRDIKDRHAKKMALEKTRLEKMGIRVGAPVVMCSRAHSG